MRRYLVLLGLALACAGSADRIPEPPGGAVAVPSASALTFHELTDDFYGRLVQRRFNTLETFNDSALRSRFRSEDLFFDYYADLAQHLDDAHFEKSRPLSVEIEEFLFEDAGHARVQVRFVGEDDRPLRPGSCVLIRRDRWELAEGQWWVVPGKL